MPPKIFNKFNKAKPQGDDDGQQQPVVKVEAQPDFDDVTASSFDQQRANALDTQHLQQAAAANQQQQQRAAAGGAKAGGAKKRPVVTVTSGNNVVSSTGLAVGADGTNENSNGSSSGARGGGGSANRDEDDDSDDNHDDDVLALTAGVDVKKLVAPISSSAPQRRAARSSSASAGRDETAAPGSAAAAAAVGADGAAGKGGDAEDAAGKAATDTARGVKFLSLHRDEIEQSRRANRNFFIQPDGAFKKSAGPDLCWLQLPRLAAVDHRSAAAQGAGASAYQQQQQQQQQASATQVPEHGDELLAGLPAGRVGTLRVHQSGKVSLVIAGAGSRQPVMLDVSVCEDESDNNARGQGAPSRHLVALLTRLAGGQDMVDGDNSGAAACDLGCIGKKLVAIPEFDA